MLPGVATDVSLSAAWPAAPERAAAAVGVKDVENELDVDAAPTLPSAL